MNELERYINDPDIMNEPMPMREIHAIRLMINDETKGLAPEERACRIHEKARKLIDEYGLKVNWDPGANGPREGKRGPGWKPGPQLSPE